MSGVFAQYNGDSLYLAAFAVSVGLLFYAQKGQAGSTGKKAVAAVALAFLFVFNGIAYWIAGKVTDVTTYYRFFWMLPVLFVIAYQLTEAFTSKQGKKILAGALAFVFCLGFGANFFIVRSNLERPKNIYGLAPDTLTVADAIMSDWGSGHDTDEELPTAAFDMYLEYQVRTYEPRICWGISRKAYLYQAKHGYDHQKYVRQQYIIAAVNEGLMEDAGKLKRCLDKSGIDYLVIRTSFDMDSYMAGISVLPVAYSENYTIYKVGKLQ